MTKRTDRQELLIERLVGLGELAASNELPLDVLEIRGFGSFFRGKARPKDVDLWIRCQRRPHRPDFDRFLELLKRIRFDSACEEQYDTPQEALDAVYQQGDHPRLPGFENGERGRFCEWLNGHTWKMLHARTMFDDLRITSPEEYAKRIIKRRFPNLNVIDFLNAEEHSRAGLRHGFSVSVWSRERPDLRSNLAELLSDERLTENTLRELRYFEKQLPMMQAEVAWLRAEIGLMLTVQPEVPPRDTFKWIEEWPKDRLELRESKARHEETLAAARKFDEEEWGSAVPADYRALGHRKALAMTESMRKELKRHYYAIDALAHLRISVARFQSGTLKSELPVLEAVAIDALSRGNAKDRKNTEAALTQFGIPIPDRDQYGFFPPL